METIIKTNTRTHVFGKHEDRPNAKYDHCIRAYGYSPDRVAVQIRSNGTTTQFAKQDKPAYSIAFLNVSDAQELVAALNKWIKSKTT